MKKLLIALLATAPLFAMAEARYQMYFHNPTNKDITLFYQSSSCMYGRGDSEFTVKANSTYPEDGNPMNLLDSDGFISCTNADKYVIWHIKDAPWNKRSITFRHVTSGRGGPRWSTSIENNGTIQSAWCHDDGVEHNCNNTRYRSYSKNMRIDLTFNPQ